MGGGGAHEKIQPQVGGQNVIYESIAGWGRGVPNMISISFSGIKTAYVHV